MQRQRYLCGWGNCSEVNTPFIVTADSRRTHFCAEIHAALWLMRGAVIRLRFDQGAHDVTLQALRDLASRYNESVGMVEK